MKQLSDKTSEILETVSKWQGVDFAALQSLEGHTLQLMRLFENDTRKETLDLQQKQIEADPCLNLYYRYFSRFLTGTWLACQSINSGLVQNSEKFKSDYIGEGLNKMGQHIPGISAITALFSGAISTWNDRQRKQGVQKIALLFCDLETAFKELGALARQATLGQETTIRQLPVPTGLLGRVKERAQDITAKLFADDVDTPLKRKAVEDCKAILTAIRDDQPCPNPSTADSKHPFWSWVPFQAHPYSVLRQ